MSMKKVSLLKGILDKLVQKCTIHFDGKSFFPLLGQLSNFLTKKALGIVLEGWIRWFKDSDIPGHCRVSAMRDYQELIYLCRMSPRRGFGDSKEGSPAFGFLRAVNQE